VLCARRTTHVSESDEADYLELIPEVLNGDSIPQGRATVSQVHMKLPVLHLQANFHTATVVYAAKN